jgi:hypothetical protein
VSRNLTIYRYAIEVADDVRLPCAATRVLSAARDRTAMDHHVGRLEVWAIVDTDEPGKFTTIHVRGTGHPLRGNEGRFIGTVIEGAYVWHLFEHKHDQAIGDQN